MKQENQKNAAEKQQNKKDKALKEYPERNILGKRIHKEKKHHHKAHG